MEQLESEDTLQESQTKYAKLQKKLDAEIIKMDRINKTLKPNSLESVYCLPHTQLILSSSKSGKTTSILNLFKDKRFRILDRI